MVSLKSNKIFHSKSSGYRDSIETRMKLEAETDWISSSYRTLRMFLARGDKEWWPEPPEREAWPALNLRDQ